MVSKPPENITLTPFERWVGSEGLKVITKHTVYDLATEPLEPWERTGCDAALLDMTHQHANALQPLRQSRSRVPAWISHATTSRRTP